MRLNVFIVLLMGGLLQGCVGSSSPPVHFYVVNPQVVSAVGPESSNLKLHIASLRLPEYLDRPHLVTRIGSNRLELSDGHQWGGNLRKNLQRTLALNLSRQLNTPNISFASAQGSSSSTLRLELDIIQYELMDNHQVSLIAQWRLSRSADRALLVTDMAEWSSGQPVDATDQEAIVKEMSQLFAQLSQTIGEQVVRYVQR